MKWVLVVSSLRKQREPREAAVIVTGIGSRKTPPAVLEDMERIGAWCRDWGVPLRSGHAEGADWAFERGAQELCIAYLPWQRFNDHLRSRARKVVFSPSEETTEIVRSVHPAPDKLSAGAWKLHGRNVYQILGTRLTKPSSVVVCWTPGGKLIGGTATALALAALKGIAIYNLAVTPAEEVQGVLEAMRARAG